MVPVSKACERLGKLLDVGNGLDDDGPVDVDTRTQQRLVVGKLLDHVVAIIESSRRTDFRVRITTTILSRAVSTQRLVNAL
jgi:hypothetical protein